MYRAVSVHGLWHKGTDGRDLNVLQLLLPLHTVSIISMDLAAALQLNTVGADCLTDPSINLL